MLNVELPRFFAYDRAVDTPFGLLGNDENALSFALGYTFHECPLFLRRFLSEIGVTGVRKNEMADVRIDLQKYGTEGITDIEIRLDRAFHVIVEAKVGLSIPSLDQCSRYAKKLDNASEPLKRLVALVQSGDESFVAKYFAQAACLKEGLLKVYNWGNFIPACVHLMATHGPTSQSGMVLQWFYRFLEREYQMKTFTTEVWILPVDTKPLWPGGWSFLDTHLRRKVYYDSSARRRAVRPLYIALHADGKVNAIHRVLSIEPATAPIEYVPELANHQAEWPRLPHTIWRLDEAVSLPKSIPVGGGMFARDVRCDLDVLLTSESVKQIEDRMRERRKKH